MKIPQISQLHHPSGQLYKAWEAFAREHPQANWFQSEVFFDFAAQWPLAEPVLLVAFKEKGMKDPGLRLKAREAKISDMQPTVAGSLLAVIIREKTPRPLRFLSARTVVYGGPLLAQGSPLEQEITMKHLLMALDHRVKKHSLFTQFRNFYEMDSFKRVFADQGYRWHERMNLLVDTPNRETAWKNLSANRRRQVKKSLLNGARIVENPDAGQVEAFYGLLKTLYKNKVKKPLPGKGFFMALHEKAREGKAAILLVEHQGEILGGIACPIMEKRAMYEWYVCGLDREYRPQGIYPSVLATWAAMEYAAKNQLPEFDFMGMGKPGQTYGVRNFKARFGGRWVAHGRFSKTNHSLFYMMAELAYNLKFLSFSPLKRKTR